MRVHDHKARTERKIIGVFIGRSFFGIWIHFAGPGLKIGCRSVPASSHLVSALILLSFSHIISHGAPFVLFLWPMILHVGSRERESKCHRETRERPSIRRGKQGYFSLFLLKLPFLQGCRVPRLNDNHLIDHNDGQICDRYRNDAKESVFGRFSNFSTFFSYSPIHEMCT